MMRLVVAVRRPSGHQRERAGQRRLEVVLAAHVVRALGLGAERRATQDEVAPLGNAER
jgi:hypothetical protein